MASASADNSKYGSTNVSKTTVTTPLGKSKTVAGLFPKEWAFLIISFVNILTTVVLTTIRLVHVLEDEPKSPEFAFSILLLINAAFCGIYVIHGLLRECVYELCVFMTVIVLVMLYCILEFSVLNPSHRTTIKLIRLIAVCGLSPFSIFLACCVSRDFGYLEFRIVGESQFLRRLYTDAAIFSSLLMFDLPAASSVVVLVLNKGTSMSLVQKVSLGVGLPFSFLWCIFGWIVLRKELKFGAVVFGLFGLVKPAYYAYRVAKVYMDIDDDTESSKIIIYCLLGAAAVAVTVWGMLMVELMWVYQNFGKGLKERYEGLEVEERQALG